MTNNFRPYYETLNVSPRDIEAVKTLIIAHRAMVNTECTDGARINSRAYLQAHLETCLSIDSQPKPVLRYYSKPGGIQLPNGNF